MLQTNTASFKASSFQRMYTRVVKDGNSPLRFATRQLKNTFFGCFVQCVHFKHFAPEPKETAVNRYDFEAWRHWKIVDHQLAKHRYVLGDAYTLATCQFGRGRAWCHSCSARIPGENCLTSNGYLTRLTRAPPPSAPRQSRAAMSSRPNLMMPRKALFPQHARLNG